MKNFTYISILIIVFVVGLFIYYKTKNFESSDALKIANTNSNYNDTLVLGFSTTTSSYIILGLKESGMKSVLGEILIVNAADTIKLTNFNGSVDELKKSFSVDTNGSIAYTEFHSFGGNEFYSKALF